MLSGTPHVEDALQDPQALCRLLFPLPPGIVLSEEALQKAYLDAVGKFTSCPYYGTEVLPEAPIEMYKKGYAKHITIMAGNTAEDVLG